MQKPALPLDVSITTISKVLIRYIPVVSIGQPLEISHRSSEQLHIIWHSFPKNGWGHGVEQFSAWYPSIHAQKSTTLIKNLNVTYITRICTCKIIYFVLTIDTCLLFSVSLDKLLRTKKVIPSHVCVLSFHTVPGQHPLK